MSGLRGIGWCVVSCVLLLSAQAVDIDGATALRTLKLDHPRLLLLDADLAALRESYKTDATLHGYADTVKQQADEALALAPLEHKLAGPRLLSVSRECVRRVYLLALAWRWSNDERYAKAAEANLLTVSAFPDWNPSHFLDTAEMSNAVGVGYDWLYSYLSPESRETIKTALIEEGLKPGIAVYKEGGSWATSQFNWNQVCNCGLTVGALAIAETDPEYAQFILPKAVASLPKALHEYDPDGAWTEGPSYWHYATRYTAIGLCAMDTALGTDFGLSDMPGLRATGNFPTYTTGPTGLLLNYADSGEKSRRKPMPCMFWLARKYANSDFSDAEHAVLAENGGTEAGHLIWYVPPTGKPPARRDLDKHFRSPVDIIVMRSAWGDSNALFVGVKGGYNQVNHGHLDLGNFEMDALGVRWARDLGSDNYNLPGYWDKKSGGKRWNIYRLRSGSHNVPMFAGEDQDPNGHAEILKFASNDSGARVTIDVSSAYSQFAHRVVRDVAMVDNRRAVVVRDTFNVLEPAEIAWGMTSDAAIELETGGRAVLRYEGKELRATVLDPPGAEFVVESAVQAAPEKANQGVNRLVVRVRAEKGPSAIAILLAPVWQNAPVTEPASVRLDE